MDPKIVLGCPYLVGCLSAYQKNWKNGKSFGRCLILPAGCRNTKESDFCFVVPLSESGGDLPQIFHLSWELPQRRQIWEMVFRKLPLLSYLEHWYQIYVEANCIILSNESNDFVLCLKLYSGTEVYLSKRVNFGTEVWLHAFHLMSYYSLLTDVFVFLILFHCKMNGALMNLMQGNHRRKKLGFKNSRILEWRAEEPNKTCKNLLSFHDFVPWDMAFSYCFSISKPCSEIKLHAFNEIKGEFTQICIWQMIMQIRNSKCKVCFKQSMNFVYFMFLNSLF